MARLTRGPIAAGSPDSETQGVDQYGPALRAYFRKRVGAAEAEDLVQDVYLAMQARGLSEIEHVDRYVFRVAANVLARRNRPNIWDRTSDREVDRLQEMIDDLSPERALMAKDQLRRLVAALQALPPRAAQAFILHRFEEMSYGEIAARMGISERSVESHIRRTLERMLAALGLEP